MTQVAARALAERMSTDAAFRNQVLAQVDADARVEFVKAAGFDCTSEEIELPGDGALSNEEMTWVSGGLVPEPSEPEPWNPGTYKA